MTGMKKGPDSHDFSGRTSGPSGRDMAGVGAEFVVLVVIGMFAGQWVDRRYDSEPWGLMGCVFLGAVMGFVSMYRAVARATPPKAEK